MCYRLKKKKKKKAIVTCPIHKVSRDLNSPLISKRSHNVSKIPFIVVTSLFVAFVFVESTLKRQGSVVVSRMKISANRAVVSLKRNSKENGNTMWK